MHAIELKESLLYINTIIVLVICFQYWIQIGHIHWMTITFSVLFIYICHLLHELSD